VYVKNNIFLNSGINCIKYASWEKGDGTAVKYISGNTYYSTLSRDYTSTQTTWYIPIISHSYNRFIDGEVNESHYDNLHVYNKRVYCNTYFLTLMPGSGQNNTFINNHFSTGNKKSCVKWFSHDTAISFETFNSYTGGTNIWEIIEKPSEPSPPQAGALFHPLSIEGRKN
jgi:hypothetical protein